MNNLAKKYRNVQHSTTDKGGVLLLLHDGILRELRKAQEAFSEAQGGELSLLKAQMGVVELDRTLNFEAGPELADSLHNLYLHMLWVMSEALEKRDALGLVPVIKMLTELREAWSVACTETRQAKRAV